jgi:hypothetical protein
MFRREAGVRDLQGREPRKSLEEVAGDEQVPSRFMIYGRSANHGSIPTKSEGSGFIRG